MKLGRQLLLLVCFFLFVACGFHLQGEIKLAPALQKLYLQTTDPYGYLARTLEEYFKMSNVQLVDSPLAANIVLVILQDISSQELLSVDSRQQTRQYNLRVTLLFELTTPNGLVLVPPQSLTETRTITIQSDQILGSSNEANLYYQQMRRSLSFALMTRISSKEITRMINSALYEKPVS